MRKASIAVLLVPGYHNMTTLKKFLHSHVTKRNLPNIEVLGKLAAFPFESISTRTFVFGVVIRTHYSFTGPTVFARI